VNNHIAVLGLAFSGTTISNYALGSLPRCGTIGESNWLVDDHPSGHSPQCKSCGENCNYISKAFREAFKKSARPHYDMIREALGVDHLISSDKRLDFYDRLEEGRKFSAVVIFKDPLYQLNSWYKIMLRQGRPDLEQKKNRYLNYYSKFYRTCIDEQVEGEKIFLSTHGFQKDPESSLIAICSYFDIEYDGTALEYWTHVHHALGGNFDPYKTFRRMGADGARIADRRPESFAPELCALTDSHAESRAVFDELAELSCIGI
jgi:hypothetical protein